MGFYVYFKNQKVRKKQFCSPFCFHRLTTLVVYVLSLVGMLVYAFTLSLGHLWVVFVTAGILGYVG